MFRNRDNQPQGNEPRLDLHDDQRHLPRGNSTSGRRMYAYVALVGVLALAAIYGQSVWNSWMAWWFAKAEAQPIITEARAQDVPIEDPKPRSAPALPAEERQQPRMTQQPPPPAGGQRRAERPRTIAYNSKAQDDPNEDWFSDARRPVIANGCTLQPGFGGLPAVLLDTMQSEVGGMVTAEVNEHVRNRWGDVLVPRGTRVIGYYKLKGAQGLAFQSRRLAVVWTEMTFEDGRSFNINNAAGQDVGGSMGFGGNVDPRWGELLQFAILATFFDGIARGGVSDDPSVAGDIQNSASSTIGRTGREVTREVFGWEPEITIPAGTPVRVEPTVTLQVC